MLAIASAVERSAQLSFPPAHSGVLSWNTFAEKGTLEFRLLSQRSGLTPWLPYAQWSPGKRSSFSASQDGVRVEVDVIRSAQRFDSVEVRAPGVFFDTVWFATPCDSEPSLPYATTARILDVPPLSQYGGHGERGWCSAASLAMLNAYHGLQHSVEETAAAVFDEAYGGTGNWAFNAAFSGSLGLRAAVTYLRNLDRAQRLIEAGIPIALSYRWKSGELAGAPVEHSDGHLVVLCGFTESGDCVVNDPAHQPVRTVYPRAELERLWQRGGGVAYVVAPHGIDFVPIVNA